MTKRITICCEGKSEQAYIQQLNAFIESRDADHFAPSLIFHPIPVGCGKFTPVRQAIQNEHKKNPKQNLCAWVDYDLYHPRREESERQNYLSRSQGVPDFHFSFYNFEDFLILHYPLATLQEWALRLGNTGHFTQPLYDDEYKPHFKAILPDYEKGSLPAQFVNADTLGNLKRNLPARIISPPSDEPDFRDFAGFLLAEFETAYPELYRSLP